MPVAAIGINSQALWYTTRGTGLVAMVLLTVTLVLGITQIVRFARPGLPRFVISGLHKNASLVAMVLLAVHIVTAVADTYAPISVVDVFVPFTGTYRPVWLGLGALALDLMIVLVISSLIRDRIGLRLWRAIHWAAYASWPVALAHGLGTGTDTKISWVLAVYALCLASVVGSLGWRLVTDWNPDNALRRTTLLLAAATTVLAVIVWTAAGPLRPGWARAAGTPASLLGKARTASVSLPATPSSALNPPFTDSFAGSLRQGSDGEGAVSVTISGVATGAVTGHLALTLQGTPASGGGITLSTGQATFGPTAEPAQYTGAVVRLAGQVVVASVTDATGKHLTLHIELEIDQSSSSVAGVIRAGA